MAPINGHLHLVTGKHDDAVADGRGARPCDIVWSHLESWILRLRRFPIR
jgi:hypothetical protein